MSKRNTAIASVWIEPSDPSIRDSKHFRLVPYNVEYSDEYLDRVTIWVNPVIRLTSAEAAHVVNAVLELEFFDWVDELFVRSSMSNLCGFHELKTTRAAERAPQNAG